MNELKELFERFFIHCAYEKLIISTRDNKTALDFSGNKYSLLVSKSELFLTDNTSYRLLIYSHETKQGINARTIFNTWLNDEIKSVNKHIIKTLKTKKFIEEIKVIL